MKRPRSVEEAFALAKRTGRPYVARLERDAEHGVCEHESCARLFRASTHVAYMPNGENHELCATHTKMACGKGTWKSV